MPAQFQRTSGGENYLGMLGGGGGGGGGAVAGLGRVFDSYMERQMQKRKEETMQSFLAAASQELPKRGRVIKYNYIDHSPFAGLGEDDIKDFLRGRGMGDEEVDVSYKMLTQERERMQFEEEDVVQFYAQGLASGLKESEVSGLLESAFGDAFVGDDDAKESILREFNSVRDLFTGNIQRTQSLDLKPSESLGLKDILGNLKDGAENDLILNDQAISGAGLNLPQIVKNSGLYSTPPENAERLFQLMASELEFSGSDREVRASGETVLPEIVDAFNKALEEDPRAMMAMRIQASNPEATYTSAELDEIIDTLDEIGLLEQLMDTPDATSRNTPDWSGPTEDDIKQMSR